MSDVTNSEIPPTGETVRKDEIEPGGEEVSDGAIYLLISVICLNLWMNRWFEVQIRLIHRLRRLYR